MGKTIGIIAGIVVLAFAIFLGIKLIDVDQTEEGRLPDVDVVVEDEGNLPEFEVETGEIEVGTETETIEVEVPTVDIEEPDENQ